jgi:hypothetical protein
MPPNYRQYEGSPLARSERRAGWAVAVAVVVIGAGLGLWQVAGGGGGGPKGRCVSINVASSTGGAFLQHCGPGARAWCATQARLTGEVAVQARAACRRDGFLPGP